jgi:hypothetical protein
MWITRSGGYASETVINQGTLRKSGGAGTMSVYPPLSNMGMVDAVRGMLNLSSFNQITGETRLAGGFLREARSISSAARFRVAGRSTA